MSQNSEVSNVVNAAGSQSDQTETVLPVCNDQDSHRFSDLTDKELLGEFVATQSSEAMTEFVSRHSKKVLMVCQSINYDKNDVEDAYQTTFLAAVVNAAKLDSVQSHGAWLCRVAYNASLKILKSKQRLVSNGEFEILNRKPDPIPETWQIIENRESFQQLLAVLWGLPRSYQDCLVLAYFEDLSRSEIALRLGKSESSVKALLQRGRKLLRSRLLANGTAPVFVFYWAGFSTSSIGCAQELAKSTVANCKTWFELGTKNVPESILSLSHPANSVSLVNFALISTALVIVMIVAGLSGANIMDIPVQSNQNIELTANTGYATSDHDYQIQLDDENNDMLPSASLVELESAINRDSTTLNKLNDWMIHKQDYLKTATDEKEIRMIERILDELESESNEIKNRLSKNRSLLQNFQ